MNKLSLSIKDNNLIKEKIMKENTTPVVYNNMNRLKEVSNDINMLSNLSTVLDYQAGLHNSNVQNLENSNHRYWIEQANYNQIINNEQSKYHYFQDKEQAILCDINKPNQPIHLWRYKEQLYYRPSQYSELIIGEEKKIAQEISSRYGNINIHFVSDLNDALSYKKMKIRIDTTYITINSIPVVEDEVFDINHMQEVFINKQGFYSRNTLLYTPYLSKRFYNYNLTENKISKALHFIDSMSTIKDLQYLANRFGGFLKNLSTSNAIVLVGNKNVSEDILLEKILKPIFGSQYYITITDKMLQTMSIEEILENKLIYHIDHIPYDENDRKKLREILISILVNKSIQIENRCIPIHGQVIITIDEADMFLKDFIGSSDVFFVDSMENIMTKLQEEDEISFYKKLDESLEYFSEELSVLGNIHFNPTYNDTNNYEFVKLLNDIDTKICDISNVSNNKPILDPYDNSIDSLIPDIERHKHTYITGSTGSGKSILITTLLYRDILRNDCSTVLLDPHGDLAENTVKLVQDRTRLIYINPFMSEEKTPTINLFHLANKNESNIAKLTQMILNVLKSVNSDETFSGAMEDVLENCIRVLLRKGGGSFEELYRFMNDKRNKDLVKYGKESKNPMEADFFDDDFESSKPTKDAIKRRLKKLLNDHVFSNLMNGKNTIDLEQAMNTNGKIIIFNIPKGKMPNTYKYYIRFIVEYIQIIALKRADTKEDDRVHTHLYIDEAHNFITSTATISEILTESRKYKLFVTFAHQTISQIKDINLRDILTTMTNVKIVGKNSNKTLEVINKTLNTKLEDVEKLQTGEFYLSAGNNDILKVNNTDKLLDGKEDISDDQWEEHKQYQLDNYYRRVQSIDDLPLSNEESDQKIDEFINAIKSVNIPYFENVSKNQMLYDELIYNFNYDAEYGSGYISKQDLYLYFNLIYDQNYFSDNKELLKLLKIKDDFFKQDVNSNKTYNGKKRFFLS